MHKMCNDERKCAVMKGGLCNNELRRNENLVRKSRKRDVKRLKKIIFICKFRMDKYQNLNLWLKTKKGHQKFPWINGNSFGKK